MLGGSSIARVAGTDPLRTVVPIAVAGCALAFAAVAGWWVVPEYGVDGLWWVFLGTVALAGAIAVYVSPILGVLVLAFVIPLENLVEIENSVLGDSFDSGLSWVRVIGMVVFGAWGLQRVINRQSWSRILSASILWPALLFLLLAGASLMWVVESEIAIEDLLTTVQLLALVLLVVDVVDSRVRLEWVVRMLVLGGLVMLGLTLAQGFLPQLSIVGEQHNVRAGGSISGGVNDTANYIVLITPLAFYMLRARAAHMWRMLGLTYVVLAPLGVTETFSRIGFVIFPMVFASQVWDMAMERRRNIAYIAAGGLIAGGMLVATVDWDAVLDRVDTIGPGIKGTEGEGVDTSRMHHWLGAIAIFDDHPLVGVGYGNYGVHFRDTYQYLVPDKWVVRFYTSQRSPHSSFLGLLAELGLIGTLAWLWLIATAIIGALRSWIATPRANRESHRVLSQAVFFSLCAYLLYSVFAEVHLDKLLWLLLGLASVLPRLVPASEQRVDADQAPLTESIR